MIIYTTGPQCGRCNSLKEAMQKAGITYEEKPLDASVMARCLCETDEWVQAAPLVLDGYVWHFADDLFDASGNLKHDWLKILKGVRLHKEFSGAGGKVTDIDTSKCGKIWGNL